MSGILFSDVNDCVIMNCAEAQAGHQFSDENW